MPVPQLSAEQRRLAFERSLAMRQQRSGLKANIARWTNAGISRLEVFKMIWPEPCAQTMKVYDLLVSLHAVGPLKAERYLEQAGIPLKNTVRACGPKQRERLFNLLR
jgi:hypothetical protein